jgi:hypothetical protein
MPRNKTIDNIIAAAEQIARVWRENPTFTLGEITLAKLETMIADLRAKRGEIEDTRTKLKGMINDANALSGALNGVNTRALSGYRAVFGPNSTQYEQAGGTRTDERRKSGGGKKKGGGDKES